MAQDRIRPAVVDRREPAAFGSKAVMPDCVDALVNDKEPTDRDPVVNLVLRQADVPQLPARNDAVLPPSERSDQVIEGTLATWTGTIAVYVARVLHAPELPPARVTALFAL
jgi:hypothetical protein